MTCFVEERESSEYNNTADTSQQGQTYLQLHPEMWQYFDQQQQEPSLSSSQQQNYKIMGEQDVVPETIPSYPASAMMPGAVSSGNVYGYPLGVASNIYDLSSQPELTEEVKYPMYHNVRKHGNYVGNVIGGGGVGGPPSIVVGSEGAIDGSLAPMIPVSDGEVAVGMSNGNGDGLSNNLNINLNRREYQGVSGNGNQHHSSHHTSRIPLSSVDGNGRVLLAPPENPLDTSNRVVAMGSIVAPSVVGSEADAAAAISSTRGGKPGEISPDELWNNYYRNVGENDARGNGGIVDDSLRENRPGKYLGSPANDPYEKRSGGASRPINRVSSYMDDDNGGGQPNIRSSRREEMYPGNSYVDPVMQGRQSPIVQPSVDRLSDVDGARMLEQERHLIQKEIEQQQRYRQHQQEMHNQQAIPSWRKHSTGYYDNTNFMRTESRIPERIKRHIGAHDGGGIQRLISTG